MYSSSQIVRAFETCSYKSTSLLFWELSRSLLQIYFHLFLTGRVIENIQTEFSNSLTIFSLDKLTIFRISFRHNYCYVICSYNHLIKHIHDALVLTRRNYAHFHYAFIRLHIFLTRINAATWIRELEETPRAHRRWIHVKCHLLLVSAALKTTLCYYVIL